jgi:hypothetical protein
MECTCEGEGACEGERGWASGEQHEDTNRSAATTPPPTWVTVADMDNQHSSCHQHAQPEGGERQGLVTEWTGGVGEARPLQRDREQGGCTHLGVSTPALTDSLRPQPT